MNDNKFNLFLRLFLIGIYALTIFFAGALSLLIVAGMAFKLGAIVILFALITIVLFPLIIEAHYNG